MPIGRTSVMLSAMNNSEYYNGLTLAKSGTISVYSQNSFWKDEYTVMGGTDTKAEGDNNVFTKIVIDLKMERIKVAYCSCGKTRGALCRHGTALALVWIEHAQSAIRNEVHTDSSIHMLMQHYEHQTIQQYAALNHDGLPFEYIRLQPLLSRSFDTQGYHVEFKVGTDRFYVIKDLSEFAVNIQEKNTVRYGQKLEFVHSPESFTPDSQELLSFIMNEMVLLPKVRAIDITSYNIDGLFRCVGDEITVSGMNGIKKVPILDQNPVLSMKMQSYLEEGAKLVLQGHCEVLGEGKSLYLYDGNAIYRCDKNFTQAMSVLLQTFASDGDTAKEFIVHKKDLKEFYGKVLRYVEPYLTLTSQDILLEQYIPEPLKAKFFLDLPRFSELTLHFELSYGDTVFTDFQETAEGIVRETGKEMAIQQLLHQYFNYNEAEKIYHIVQDDDALYRFMSEGLEKLLQLGELYATDAAKNIYVKRMPKVRVGVSLQGDLLDLTIDPDGMSREELLLLLNSYRQKKRYFRMKSGEFLRLDGTDAPALDTLQNLTFDLGIKEKEFAKGSFHVPRYRAFYLDRILQANDSIAVKKNDALISLLDEVKNAQAHEYEIPDTFHGTLREYQKKGYQWLCTLHRYGLGGILADEMGLGKTIQIITLLLHAYAPGSSENITEPSIIICPASLVYNWASELERFADSLKIQMVVGDVEERSASIQHYRDFHVLITSYDLLRRDIEMYQDCHFLFEIIDEAQFIKNQNTKNAHSVKQIQTKTRFALTGTPIENRLSELWSIFDYLMPGYLFSYGQFKNELELPIAKNESEEASDRLKKMISPFVLRRRKRDVLTELPDKLEDVIYSQMSGEQKKLYTAVTTRLLDQLQNTSDEAYHTQKIQVLAELTRLRQICCSPELIYDNYTGGSAKLDTCLELVNEAISGGHKILLFSQFTTMLDVIAVQFQKENISYVMLTGETPKEKRMELVSEFQEEDSKISVFLISLKAGGTGLNLTAADVVIHYDPWWNIAAQNQATDRTHRIGQKNIVSVHKLIIKDTVEEKILKLQEAKNKLAEDVLSGEQIALGALSREELLSLLQ